MAVEPTAPCPHCKAENLAHRRDCWRCKRTLPTSFAMDARLRSRRQYSSTPQEPVKPSRAEVEDALGQATIIEEDAQTPLPPGAGGFGKRLLWLFRKHTESA